MNTLKLNKLLLGTSLIAAMAYAAPSYAQMAEDTTVDDAEVELLEEVVEEEAGEDVMIVTGSRIKRDAFSSISPLQVITTDLSEDVGLFDPATLLQTSEAAGGQQIDATFQGFVLDNGPGSQTLNLRGLGADRTLLLINGRRVAPAGVEGSPSNPSINLIPGSLVERYDLLLDGASSVYGSDAVAGVGNIVLKRDFEGFEVQGNISAYDQGSDVDYRISGTYGKNFDRGFIGFGAEYDRQDETLLSDRDFLKGCDTHYEITEEGEIRTLGIADGIIVNNRTPGVTVSDNDCKVSGITGRIFSPFQTYGSVYYTDGPGNSGIPGFDESTAGGVDIDADGDGLRDVDFQNVNLNGAFPDITFIPAQDRYSFMSFGEYTLEGDANLTPYFEFLYNRIETGTDNNGPASISPVVPSNNPFNPCNIQAGGADCAAAESTLLGRPGANAGFSLPVRPVVSLAGDRDNFDVTQEQYRIVGGVKGDIPGLNIGDNVNDWTFDVYGMYSRSNGKSTRIGIREDKLAFALGVDPSADFDGDGIADNDGDGVADEYDAFASFPPTLAACDASGLANPDLLLPDVTQGCVPLNLFAPSVLNAAVGQFESAAQRDYILGARDFDTIYEQTVISGFATGDIFTLPAGPVSAVVGAEYRKDKIDSQASLVASNGLIQQFFSDRGAQGSKSITEAFGELNVPLVAGKPLFRELELNLSGRLVDEEFYGFASTYSVKGGWRPVDSVLLKASYGTSFRAPNLRENFLGGSTGFLTLTDPCAVPGDAYINGVYTPATDTRDPRTLENCRREGRDPTVVGTDATLQNTQTQTSTEILTGGSFDLEEETSTALTLGIAFEQPFFDSFDLQLNANYYDIKVDGSIISPSSQFILNDCYTRQENVRSAFCDRITTDVSPDSRLLVSDVDASFLNQDRERAKGMDFEARFGKEFQAFDRTVDFGFNLRANRILEKSDTFIGDDGLENFDEDQGEFGFAKWTGRGTATLDVDKMRFTWQARYISAVSQQADGVDDFSDALDTRDTGFVGDTCSGAGDAFCRDVGFAGDVWTHTASLRYRADSWTLRAGVSNIFDRNPPRIDTNEVFGLINTPIGGGYDLNGRNFFASFNKQF